MDILIKLRRQYKDHEVISALYKRLSEQDVELGKLKSYVEELEYRERQVKNLDYQIKMNKLTYKNMVLDIKNTEPYKNLLEVNKNMQEQRDELLKTLQSLVLSMSAHPDCTKGSEFDDLSSLAQELINKIKDNE